MQTYDLVMIGVLVVATVLGAWKGMAWQLASLSSLVVSYAVALKFSPQLAPYLAEKAPLNKLLAMLAIYAACSLLIWLAFRYISGVIDRVRLKEFDRHMGGLVGAAKGGLLCIGITYFAVSMTEDPLRKSIMTSRSGHYIGYVLDRAPAVLPHEVHGILEPYLKELDANLEHDHVDWEPDHAHPVPAAIR